MALTDENGMVMPVSPMYGGVNNGCGFGGDWAWIILLLLLGWGNNGNGFGGGFNGNSDFPWLMTGQQNINANTNNGFRDAMLNDGISGIRSDINGISTQLCNGFAGVEQGANARQMADMQQMFGLQSQLADCCCENRLATCQTQNIVQNEGNATRQTIAQSSQAVLDKLCQLELDGKNDKIADLERQLTQAQFNASQSQQNALMQQGFSDEVDALYNRLNNCPVPTTPVYGRTPIFTCGNNGCGCGNNF